MVRALTVVKETHIILEHIRIYSIHGVIGLVAEKIVALLATRECDETVVEPRITEEKQVFGSIGRRSRTVIEHLHKATVGCHIGSS